MHARTHARTHTRIYAGTRGHTQTHIYARRKIISCCLCSRRDLKLNWNAISWQLVYVHTPEGSSDGKTIWPVAWRLFFTSKYTLTQQNHTTYDVLAAVRCRCCAVSRSAPSAAWPILLMNGFLETKSEVFGEKRWWFLTRCTMPKLSYSSSKTVVAV